MDAKAFSSAVAGFSAKFCNELDKSNNAVCAPLSAEYLLALLALGSEGAAQEELLSSLNFPDVDCIRSSFTALTSDLKTVEGVTLRIANRVYMKDGPYAVKPELREDAINVFDVVFEKLNFDDGPGSARAINDWVESQTNNRIKDLISSDAINSNTKMVLVNALYFKGLWKNQFSPEITSKQPFHIDTQTVVDIPMMYQEDGFKYGVSPYLQAKVLEMAYESEQASMVIVLPNEINGLNTVLQKLADGYDFISELDKLSTIDVKVTIPKFKIETDIDLSDILPQLGIKEIFNSGVTNILDNNESLSVSHAVQKVFIEVNEEGAEGAAASGMVVSMHSASLTPVPRFYADRPFVFLLIGVNHTTLLMGVFRGIA